MREQLRQGRLVTVLDDYNKREMVFHVLWPSTGSSPKIRAFVDFVAAELFAG